MRWWSRRADRAARPSIAEQEALVTLRETARLWIASGFRSRDGLAEELVEYHDNIDLPADQTDRLAVSAVDIEWEVRLAEQATWTHPGDHARVQAAFDALDAQAVVGRMNFTCCQTCGTAEIAEERTPLPADEMRPGDDAFREWGFVFFHEQDAERLAEEPADLFLNFGTFRWAPDTDPILLERAQEGHEDARRQVVEHSDRAVGRLVAEALRAQGLTVDWNDEPARRLHITGVEWRKPLPS